MSNRRCLVALALFLAPVTAAAQGGPWGPLAADPCIDYGPENTIVWPGGDFGDAVNFGRVVLAEFDDDQAQEGVVLAGGIASVLWAAPAYDSPCTIEFESEAPPPTDVKDIATLHGVTLDGTDGVLMTDDRGLFLVTYFDEVFQDPEVLDDSAWIDAAPIHVDCVDDNASEDVIGVAANHRTVLQLLRSGSGFIPGASLTVPYDVLDVVPVDWNRSDDGEREIVALTRRGLYVYDQTGALQQTVIHLSLTGSIARLHSSDFDCGERLVWARRIVPMDPPSQLLVVAQGTSPALPPLQEGPWSLTVNLCDSTLDLDPLALLAGRYDDDDDDDLLVVHEGNQTALILRNRGATARFDPSSSDDFDVMALSLTPSDAGNVGLPAFEPLDDDEFDDIVFPVAAEGKIEVFTSLPYHRAIIGQLVTSQTIIENETEYGAGDHGAPPGTLRFAFEVPEKYDDFTHLRVVVWQREHGAANTDPDAIYHAVHVLDDPPSGSNRHQWIQIRSNVFPDGDCWPVDDKPHFFMEFRFIRDEGGGQQTISKIFAGGFTLDHCPAGPEQEYGYTMLTSEGYPGSSLGLNDHNGLTGPEASRQLLGAYVPMSRVPYFGDNVKPSAGDLVIDVPPTQTFVDDD